MSASGRSERAGLLLYGYIRELQLMSGKSTPMDVMKLCWKFFFTPFDSSIISSDKDVDDFFELILQKISMERMKKAKLLFKGTRDGLLPFPYDKLTHNGPYLFVIGSAQGHVFGSYCSVNIQRTNRELNKLGFEDKEAFLWVLKGVRQEIPSIYSAISDKRSITFDDNSIWLHFGDLVVYDCMDDYHYCRYTDGGYGLRYYNIPEGKSLVGTNTRYRFQMAEIEIFSIPTAKAILSF